MTMRWRPWPLNKVPARFAPEVLRDYWRNRTLAVLGLAIVALLCWIAWEFLPREGVRPVVAVGTIRDVRKGWLPQSKYNPPRGPVAYIGVTLPEGGSRQLAGDIRLLDQCRRGAPIRLLRFETNIGVPEWRLAPNACGPIS